MYDSLINNFTSGEISPKLGGRPDLGLYHTGAARIENFLVMLQGGLTRRPGTIKLGALEATSRLIPFTISVNLSFVFVLTNKKIKILTADGVDYGISFIVDYLENELSEIQFTQDYDTLYLAHRNHQPLSFKYIGSSFQKNVINPITMPDDSSMFQSIGNYPGCVAYCSNRLWFASSENQPYRLWSSRPFEPTNFETYDVIESVEKVIKDAPWADGWEEDQSLIYEDRVISRKSISADNAMILEVGSNRNDRIEWILVGRNLIVGTASGEWMMPGNIDALNQQIVQTSAYGSAPIQALNVNEDILYIQSGNKRCRGYVLSEQGYSSPDLTYIADHILEAGVKEWTSQRVPEPRIYAVLKNGDMAVLSYNKMYGIQGWTRWTFEGEVDSIVVMDSPTGQDVLISIKRNGIHYLEKFDFDSNDYRDQHEVGGNPIAFESLLVSNRFETTLQTGSTIGKRKKIGEITFRLLRSGSFRAGYDKLETYKGNVIEGDVRVRLGGGYQKELQMELRSVDNDPLTVLAMVYGLEVGT